MAVPFPEGSHSEESAATAHNRTRPWRTGGCPPAGWLALRRGKECFVRLTLFASGVSLLLARVYLCVPGILYCSRKVNMFPRFCVESKRWVPGILKTPVSLRLQRLCEHKVFFFFCCFSCFCSKNRRKTERNQLRLAFSQG